MLTIATEDEKTCLKTLLMCLDLELKIAKKMHINPEDISDVTMIEIVSIMMGLELRAEGIVRLCHEGK